MQPTKPPSVSKDPSQSILVIAWRIMLMTLLGRETPELPVEVLFSDLEIEVLKAYAKKKA